MPTQQQKTEVSKPTQETQPPTLKEESKTLNASIALKKLETINEVMLNYVVIHTKNGKIAISIGDKNYQRLTELLQ